MKLRAALILLPLLLCAHSLPPSAAQLSVAPATSASSETADFSSLNAEEAVSSKVYQVCVFSYPPLIFYDNDTNTFSGYEWELFEAVSKAMGFTYSARIMADAAAVVMGLMMPPDTPLRCDLAPASFKVGPLDYPLGPGDLKFSFPTFHNAAAIVTSVTFETFNRWCFGLVFTPALWATLLGTAAVLAVLTYAAERDYAKRGLGKTKYPTALRPGMYEALYNTVAKLVNAVQDLKVTSLSGKLISMGWGFLVLVVSATYTACITATLNSQNFKTTISSVEDLPYYTVITPSMDLNNYHRFGFIPERVVLNTEADLYAMLDRVSSGSADALIFSYPWLMFHTATRCDLAVVGELFSYYEGATAFSGDTPASFINEYNAQLVTLKQQGVYEDLEAKYLTPPSDLQCPPTSDGPLVVTLSKLAGLWIVLGVCVALAMVVLLLPYVSSRLQLDIRHTPSMYNIRERSRSLLYLVDPATASSTARDVLLGNDVEVKLSPSFETDIDAQPTDKGPSLHVAKLQEPSTAQAGGLAGEQTGGLAGGQAPLLCPSSDNSQLVNLQADSAPATPLSSNGVDEPANISILLTE